MFPLYTGESLEELLDGIARRQMIEKTLYRDARPRKNRFATEDLRILRNNAAHEQNYALETQSIQANITDLSRRNVARRGINPQLSTINSQPLTALYERRIKREAKLAVPGIARSNASNVSNSTL